MTSQTATSERNQIVPWWLVLIEGIAAIIVGIFLFTRPAATMILIVQFLGIYWLVSGIFTLVSLFWNRSVWGWKLFSGFLGIIAGIMIINNPLWSTLLVPATLVIVLGITGIFIGTGQLVQAFRGGGWGIGILGVLSIILGILLLTRPVIAGLALPLTLAFLLVGGGIVAIFAAFGLRGAQKRARQTQVQAQPAVRAAAVDISQQPAAAVSAAASPVVEAPAVAAPAVAAPAVAAGAAAAAVGAVKEMDESAPEQAEALVEDTAVTEQKMAEVLVDEPAAISAAAAETAGEVGESLGDAAADVSAAGGAAGAAAAGVAAGAVAVVSQADESTAEQAEALVVTAAATEQKMTEAVDASATVSAAEAESAPAVEQVDAAAEELVEEVSETAITGNFDPADLDEIAKFKNALEYVEGIGPAFAEKLKAIGLVTCLDLLKAGASRKGREEVVEKSGISSKLILKWVNHLDLYRIKGVGSEYADLLEAAGVDTVVELAHRNPVNLIQRMLEVNEEKHLVRKPPTPAQVEDWVAQSKGLSRLITY